MEVKEIHLKADGLELVGELHVPSRDKAHPALCICHGIPAVPPDPTDRGYTLLAQRFCHAGFTTLIFNFRGTGRSEGNLDILGWSRDLQAALDFLYDLKEINKTRFCLLGFSGGAAEYLQWQPVPALRIFAPSLKEKRLWTPYNAFDKSGQSEIKISHPQ